MGGHECAVHGGYPHAPPAGAGTRLTPARILIVTDAWHPQINGVVRTLTHMQAELQATGNEICVIGPDRFATLPCPTYPDIRLAMFPRRRLGRLIQAFAPDYIHVATEGPLGMAASRWCATHGLRFTTAYHTRFPEYLHARTRLPPSLAYRWLRRFHNRAAATFVATPSLRAELSARGFSHLALWSRGVDLKAFSPGPRPAGAPVFLYVGRVAPEKNLRAFLSLDLPGEKRVVGGGPDLAQLQREFPSAIFTGPKTGPALAAEYATASVFVFPSRTDTFGLVLLEALASGTPVAAYPVPGPTDVLAGAAPPVGALHKDLHTACMAALTADRTACRAYAEHFSWPACAGIFRNSLIECGSGGAAPSWSRAEPGP